MDLTALHEMNGTNTDCPDSDDSVDDIVPIQSARVEAQVRNVTGGGDEEQSDDNAEYDTVSDGFEGSLPDLEDDPVQETIRPIHESTQTNEKECWVCFVSESEMPDSEWVRPCKCDGSVGYVHQECVKRWVEEKQKSDINMEVECPQCQTKYRFVFPKLPTHVKLLIMANQLCDSGVTALVISGLFYSANLALVFYSRCVLKCMVSPQLDFFTDGECKTLSPYREMLIQNISEYWHSQLSKTWTIATVGRVTRFAFGGFSLVSNDRLQTLWSNMLFNPFEYFKDNIAAWCLPYALYSMRKINWDEPILRKLDALDSVKSRYEPATTSKSLRRFIGGLVMPFAARLVGNLVFDESTTPGKRFICGAGVYLVVKGGLNVYRKNKVRRFQRARKVKSYTEGAQHESENVIPHFPFTLELTIGH